MLWSIASSIVFHAPYEAAAMPRKATPPADYSAPKVAKPKDKPYKPSDGHL